MRDWWLSKHYMFYKTTLYLVFYFYQIYLRSVRRPTSQFAAICFKNRSLPVAAGDQSIRMLVPASVSSPWTAYIPAGGMSGELTVRLELVFQFSEVHRPKKKKQDFYFWRSPKYEDCWGCFYSTLQPDVEYTDAKSNICIQRQIHICHVKQQWRVSVWLWPSHVVLSSTVSSELFPFVKQLWHPCSQLLWEDGLTPPSSLPPFPCQSECCWFGHLAGSHICLSITP